MRIGKKLKSIYQPYMLRPTIYQCVTKSSIALAVALLWGKFINTDGIYSIVRDAFFVAGIFFFACVWFQYLRMDGLSVNRAPKAEKKKEKKGFLSKDIVDFADEKIVSFAELEDDEQMVCRILSNTICGCIFFISSLISLVIL